MSPIAWKPEFSVGVDAVDHEHRELIDMVAALQRALTGARPGAEVEPALGELMRAISAHFALEERFMGQNGYDRLAEHKADHERLLDELRDLMEGHGEGGGDAVALRLEHWFIEHFRTHDARLHRRLGDHPH